MATIDSIVPPKPMNVAAKAPTEQCDVVVIGGGVNGTGVARDLALRGLKVVLFERNDLAFGASGNSSGMIHGGPRYLSQNPSVTESSCRDSGYIQRIAPFLLFRIPFLMPVKAGVKGRIMIELVDAFFRLYDDYQPLKRGEKHTRLTPSEMQSLEPGLTGKIEGGITFDEWGVDGARLCALNAVDAIERGAKVHTHTTVESIAKNPANEGENASGHAYAVVARDALDNRVHSVATKMVVNATGAWGPVTAALGNLPSSRVRVRPGKGIHITYDRRLTNYAIVSETIDGRQIFLEPWQNMSILGTTDDDYYGSLDDVNATSEEVRYLVQGLARVFPSIRNARAIGTYAGVRPTLYEYGPHEDALSREHAVVDHEVDGAPGIYSMIGGKLASYRLFAEEMSDLIAAKLCPGERCRTHEVPLPGGEREVDDALLAPANHITPVASRRLVYRHGARAERILERVKSRPREATVVCPCEPVLEAEVRHSVREEGARTVDDVSRRTRLGLGACGGMRCAARCGQLVAEECGLEPREGIEQARTFLLRQAKKRLVAMGPDQARQEMLALEVMQSHLGRGEE
ncbi:MAG: glycerol-3-phosphate dehydrogenase/oxidase [Polyangiaceae bacterium]